MSGRTKVTTCVLVLAVMVSACGKSAGEKTESQPHPTAAATTGDKILPVPTKIREILGSNQEGRSYRCLVCHSEYQSDTILGTKRVADKILKSVETGSMPLSGDKLQPKDLATIQQWVRSF